VENNTSINLYCIDFFYYNKKITKNQQKLLYQSNKNKVLVENF